jgi:hypothetical protein
MREITPAEEDRDLFTSAPWCGGYRWYRSSNVICIEQYERRASARSIFPAGRGLDLHLDRHAAGA